MITMKLRELADKAEPWLWRTLLTIICLFVVLLILIIIVVVVQYQREPIGLPHYDLIPSACFPDCQWVSTNCCPEHSGANWECTHLSQSDMNCSEDAGHIWPCEGCGCTEEEVPKPNPRYCTCLNESCVDVRK